MFVVKALVACLNVDKTWLLVSGDHWTHMHRVARLLRMEKRV